MTEMLRAKPDGYTLGVTANPNIITTYLDPRRGSIYKSRKDFQLIALQVLEPLMVMVKGDSRFKTMKDLVEAARSNPGKVTAGDAAIGNPGHLAILQLEQMEKIKFANVHTGGDAPALPALMGGHIDAFFGIQGTFVSSIKSGDLRVLGILDNKPLKFLPDVPTAESQGYKLYQSSNRGVGTAAGTPKEIVDILTKAVKRAMDTDEVKTKMDQLGQPQLYMDPDQYGAFWDNFEKEIAPLMPLVMQAG